MNYICTLCVVVPSLVIECLGFMLMYFLYGKNDYRIEIFKFTFGNSPFDLLIINILKFGLIFGAILGQQCNRVKGTRKICCSSKLVIYLSCFIIIYTVLKTLYYIEDGPTDFRKSFLIGLTFLSSITINVYWRLLGSCKFTRKSYINTSINDDSTNDDDDSVSSGDSEDCEDSEDKKINIIDEEAAKKLSTIQTVWQLIKLCKDDIVYILIALVALISCSSAQVFLPYYTGLVVDYIVIEKSVKKFHEAMFYMALITVVSGLASGIRAGFFTFIHARYMLRLQNKLFSSIMKMEIAFFDVRKTGEITSRLTSDCTKVGDTIGLNLNVFLRNVIKIIGILFFMIKISWKLSIVTLVSIPVIAVISEAFGDKYRILSEKVQTGLSKANESAEEAISNVRTVRSFAAENDEIKKYSECLKVPYKLSKQESILSCLYRWSTEVTDLTMSLLILFYGGHLVIRNDLRGGSLISFILYSIELGFAFEEIGDVYTGLMEAVGASKNLLVYINRIPKIKFDGQINSGSFVGNVMFKNVSFSYPARDDVKVLNEISFEAKQGEVVALVGPSGGGKSSIVNLLEHFYEPTCGNILVDDMPLNAYEHHYIHEKISLVQQEPVLFARTISENINYGLRYPSSLEDVKNAAIMANAHSFIQEMTMNYDTGTGEKGIQLSGGQKQRVAIARALIRNPSILILDEATSALDSESEYLVQQALNKNMLGRTVIVIAHRLSTIEKADKILVIDKGKIVQVGKHTDLINKEGMYANLVKRQLLGTDGLNQDKPVIGSMPILSRQKSSGSRSTSPKSSFSKSSIRI